MDHAPDPEPEVIMPTENIKKGMKNIVSLRKFNHKLIAMSKAIARACEKPSWILQTDGTTGAAGAKERRKIKDLMNMMGCFFMGFFPAGRTTHHELTAFL